VRVVVAGSSGFLGRELTARLRTDGHQVVRLVRRAPSASDEEHWDPYAARLDPAVVEGADVVVNVAGSPTAGNPHSKKWARELRESRVTTTRVLAEAVGASTAKPAFLAQNGIGYYGDHGREVLTEASESRGDALPTRVTRDWQAATEAASSAGARVCVLRTAPVLERRAAPLRQLLLPFRLGLGARLGDGRQSFPMISLRDWLGAVVFLAGSGSASGPFNLCCPVTPTNAEFTDALAAAVGRKARLAAPAVLLRRAAGPMAPALLGSINARPAALEAAGYPFQDRDVRDVIAAALR
jgi:uncharacterized protein (TIGR01777 family)